MGQKILFACMVTVTVMAGCEGGGQADRCRGVVCNQPPRNQCADQDTLLRYHPDGCCDPDTGRCVYRASEDPCPHGCLGGRCLGADTPCRDDGDPAGPPCMHSIETDTEFERLAVGEALRGTKYMIPASDDPDLLPTVFQNANRYELHIDFLRQVFPERYGDLTQQGYLELIYRRASRSYFAGALMRTDDAALGRIYGFGVWTALDDPDELLSMQEVGAVYEQLLSVFWPETLAYRPGDPEAIARARTWIAPPFPVYLGMDDVRTEVYTQGVCYGRVRRFSIEELEAAIGRGAIGWQDLVVVDRVPFDIETVVAGVITGGRQWELSHVNVRMARRGTPNLYVRDALDAFADLDGRLVRLEAEQSIGAGSDDRYTVGEASEEEAEAWWAGHRPDLGAAPAIDRSYRAVESVLAMDTDDDPVPLICRVGGKAANLARLYTVLDARHRVHAFAIPFAWFEDFMENNAVLDTSVQPPEEVSLRAYVQRLVDDDRARTDAAYRRERLWNLREVMRNHAEIDPQLVSLLAARIREVFGDENVPVRFRSSSNVEDALEFSGAGLYESTTVCAADSLDEDRDGPSICDPGRDEERTIERGLRRVWAGLYSNRAWEERAWYQVPQEQASMAVLVSQAFPDERANGVAFTGNPQSRSDDRYLVNAQLGDEPVVGNDPLVVPELDLLDVDAQSGEVSRIYRSRSSPLAPPGGHVLSDPELIALGGLLYAVDRDYPLDYGPYERDKVLLDLEFKIDRQGEIRIKQIRPYLDKCRHVTCNTPPEDECIDEDTLREYRAYGSCDPASGDCRYQASEVHCDNGCTDGACK